MKRKSGLGLFIVLAFASTGLMAQENATQEKAPPGERLTANVLIVDPDGQPIAGAKLSAKGMTLASVPGGSFSWIDDQPEKVKDLISGEQGKIALTYPKNPIPDETVERIHVLVQHPEFVEFSSWISPTDNPARITLERGFRVAATAIDATTGEAIRENLFGITNRHIPVDWKVAGNGTVISPVFGKDETVFRLVEIVDGKAERFSELMEVDPTERSRFLKKDVKLFDAVTVRGKLDAAVPRPVKNGFVSACVSSPREVDLKDIKASWHWKAFSKIEEDGSFVLECFPADSTLQLIAGCEGWINVPATKDEILSRYPANIGNVNVGRFHFPQLIDIATDKNEINLAMQASGRCLVTVVDDTGKPVAGVSVSLGASQLFFQTGITSGFGYCHSTGMMVNSLRSGVSPEEAISASIGRFSEWTESRTNEGGKFVFTDLAPGMNYGNIAHEEYPTESGQYYRRIEVSVKTGEEESVTVDLGKRVPREKGKVPGTGG